MRIFPSCLAVLILLVLASPSEAQKGVRILIPSDDTCNAFIAALNNGDRAALLDLGGWALGYVSGVARQSGRDILRDVTSQGLMDRIADTCQRQPDKPMSSVVMEIANALLAGAR
jgi:hypothetical protein